MKTVEFEYVVVGKITNTSEAPRAADLYFKCVSCGDIVSSQPKNPVGCSCKNIYIDPDYIRLVIRDINSLIVVKKSPFKPTMSGVAQGDSFFKAVPTGQKVGDKSPFFMDA